MESNKIIVERISDFVKDPEIHLLKDRFNYKDNLFVALGISRAENPHSDFLAWIFDSNCNLDLGTRPMRLLLHFLAKQALTNNFNALDQDMNSLYGNLLIGDFNVLSAECNREVTTYGQNNNGRIDILISCVVEVAKRIEKLNVVIENKLESDTHDNQLECYYAFISRKFDDSKNIFVLLAPKPDLITHVHSAYIKMSYQELTDSVLQPLLYNEKTSTRAKILIEEYIHALSRIEDNKRIKLIAMCEKDKKLLQAFYEKHGELIACMLLAYRESLSPEDQNHVKKLDDIIENMEEVAKSRKFYYEVNGKKLPYLSDFAREIVVLYINQHPNITLAELQEAFKEVDGMINPKPFINNTDIANDGRRRWKDTGLTVQDSNGSKSHVYTSTQWTSKSIKDFENFVKDNLVSALKIRTINRIDK